jgi:hypothetical protein
LTTGDYNFMAGKLAGKYSCGNYVNNNIFIGRMAGTNTTNSDNIFMGKYSGKYNTTGSRGIFLGMQAGFRNTTAMDNVAIGAFAMTQNQTGTQNVVIGALAGGSLTTSKNSIIGYQAGGSLTCGYNNVFVGSYAGYCAIGAYNNVFLGNCAGCNVTYGTNNIVLGNYAQASSANACNEITLGNSSIATIRAQVTTITSLSDSRDKCDIQTLNSGMDFLRQVRPVTFTWNMRDGAKVGVKEAGFIAQELEEVLNNSTIKEWLDGLVISNEDRSRLEATPGKLLPLIVKAVQELDARITALENK